PLNSPLLGAIMKAFAPSAQPLSAGASAAAAPAPAPARSPRVLPGSGAGGSLGQAQYLSHGANPEDRFVTLSAPQPFFGPRSAQAAPRSAPAAAAPGAGVPLPRPRPGAGLLPFDDGAPPGTQGSPGSFPLAPAAAADLAGPPPEAAPLVAPSS